MRSTWLAALLVWPASARAKDPLLGTWTAHEAPVTALAVSPDGMVALSGDTDGKLILWNIAKGQPIATWAAHVKVEGDAPRGVNAVEFLPDGKKAVSAGADRTVRLWDLAGGKTNAMWVGHPTAVHAVAAYPNGRWVLSGGEDQTVRGWETASGKQVGLWRAGEPVHYVALSPDASRALTAGPGAALKFWDATKGAVKNSWSGHSGAVRAARFSPDGLRAVSAGADGTMRVWELPSGRPVSVSTGHAGAIADIAVSPDGLKALTAGEDRTLRLWDIARGKEIEPWRAQIPLFSLHEGKVLRAAFFPDGRRALSSGDDKTVKMWDVSWRIAAVSTAAAADPGLFDTPVVEGFEKPPRLLRLQEFDPRDPYAKAARIREIAVPEVRTTLPLKDGIQAHARPSWPTRFYADDSDPFNFGFPGPEAFVFVPTRLDHLLAALPPPLGRPQGSSNPDIPRYLAFSTSEGDAAGDDMNLGLPLKLFWSGPRVRVQGLADAAAKNPSAAPPLAGSGNRGDSPADWGF